MNGINLKGFGVRSFTIGGLTAKWGIGENRVPPTYAEDFTSSKWTLHRNRATATVTKSEIRVTKIIADQQFIETSRGSVYIPSSVISNLWRGLLYL